MIGDRYAIIKKLGDGMQSDVYRAIDVRDGSEVAAKVFKPTDTTSEKEMLTLKNLDHPNIIKMVDVFKDWEHCYLVLEYMPEGDLCTKLLRRGLL